MVRALKEEYVPSWWTAWRERGMHHVQSRDTKAIPESGPVDFIAVQGLASTYERTWTKELDDGSRVMWLRDLLPRDLPDARVLSFEYDSQWLRDPNIVTLEDCGNRLLESILWDRTHQGSQSMCPIMARRPIILLGHSYGGLVIKQAMVTAAKAVRDDPKYEYYQAFLASIVGVQFLGTPHNGSTFAEAGILQARVNVAFGGAANAELLRPLVVGSTLKILHELHAAFRYYLENLDHLSGLSSTYFYETKKMKLGPLETKIVVDKNSACYGSRAPSEEVPLEANHKELNKFESRYESNYKRVVGCLAHVHKRAKDLVEARLGKYQYNSYAPGGDVTEIQGWLDAKKPEQNAFNDVFTRRQTNRASGTCLWAFQLPAIQYWLQSDRSDQTSGSSSGNRGLWVSGKAGSGKSVLAVHLFDFLSANIKEHNWSATDISRCSWSSETIDCQNMTAVDNKAVLYFPTSKDSTSASVIRALIHQLLYFQPTRSELQQIVLREKQRSMSTECTSMLGITILTSLLKLFPLTYIIIDGLDECARPKELVELFRDIGSMLNVRLFFLARQDAELEHTASTSFNNLKWESVDISVHNSEDIRTYISLTISKLTWDNDIILEDAIAIIDRVSERARGMFQWAKLVLSALDGVRTQDDILRTIDRFPEELNRAYTDTFARLMKNSAFDPSEALLVLKILSAAYRSLTWKELAMAVLLQKKLDNLSKFDSQSVVECVASAEHTVKNLRGPAYFSFLRPLVDIEDGQNHEAASGSSAPTVVICHHSLSQWIEGSEETVDLESPEWKKFHFTRADAHEPLTALSLVMLSSSDLLLGFLQNFREPQSSIPFLNYGGTYALAHLRAIGTSAKISRVFHNRSREEGADAHLDLSFLTQNLLEHSLEIAAGVCAGLSSSLNRVDLVEVQHLPKIIAIRRLKGALLPASQSVASTKDALPSLVAMVEELQEQQKATKSMKLRQAWKKLRLVSRSLTSDLDAEFSLRISSNARDLISSNSTIGWQTRRRQKQQLELFCRTARALRSLAILMAVDPVRGWVYSQVGSNGVDPLPALSYASEVIDMYLAVSLAPVKLLSQYDMADQFTAPSTNPYHGLLTAAHRELQVREYNGFGIAFYKEEIMQHYRISWWNWSKARLLVAAMEMYADDPQGMDSMLMIWAKQHSLYASKNGQTPDYAFSAIDNLPFQKTRFSGQLVSLRDSLVTAGQAMVVWLIKYLFSVYPPLESVFISAKMYSSLITNALRPTLIQIFSNKVDLAIGALLYLCRCRYAPWIFGSWRSTPWTDLTGIVADPKGYTPVPSQYATSWTWFIFLLVQELAFWILFMTDMINAYAPSRIEPSDLARRVSFPVQWPDNHGAVWKLVNALSSHSFYWLSTFGRIIVLEKLFLISSYWFFDLLRSAAATLTWKLWEGRSAIMYGVHLVSFTYGRSSGVVGVLKLILRIRIWNYLVSKYQPTSAVGLAYRYICLPVMRGITHLSRGTIQTVESRIDMWFQVLEALGAYILQVAQELEFRTLVFVVAGGLCMLGLFAWWIMNDPLGLESAAQSCRKAEKLAKKAANVEDPIGYLNWRGANREESLDFSFSYQLNELNHEW